MSESHYRKQYIKLFEDLFKKALGEGDFNFILTILRVDGISLGYWDTLEEAKETIQDFSKILRVASRQKNEKRVWKLALTIYCHSVEMNEAHTIIANLLRIVAGKPFSARPLWTDRILKRKTSNYIPPSATVKVKMIKELAYESGSGEFAKAIEDIYSDEVRNSFSH